MAYYVRQVEKLPERYQNMGGQVGGNKPSTKTGRQKKPLFPRIPIHAAAIRAERVAAKKQDRLPKFQSLIKSWGGVTVAYRRQLIGTPSYTLIVEEVAIAMEEGIQFAEGVTPLAVEVDEYQAVKGLRVKVERREG